MHYTLNEATEGSLIPPTDSNNPVLPPNMDMLLPQNPLDKIASNPDNNPETGDDSTISLFLFLTMFTGITIVLLTLSKGQKKQIR